MNKQLAEATRNRPQWRIQRPGFNRTLAFLSFNFGWFVFSLTSILLVHHYNYELAISSYAQ